MHLCYAYVEKKTRIVPEMNKNLHKIMCRPTEIYKNAFVQRFIVNGVKLFASE